MRPGRARVAYHPAWFGVKPTLKGLPPRNCRMEEVLHPTNDLADDVIVIRNRFSGAERQFVIDGGVSDVASYLVAIATIQRDVVGILWRARDRYIIQSLVEGVVRLEVKAVSEPPGHLHLQLMGCRTAVRIQGGDRRPGLERPAALDRTQRLRYGQIPLVGIPGNTRTLVADVGEP